MGVRKRPLGKPRYRWKDDIKVNVKMIGYEAVKLNSSGSGKGSVVRSHKNRGTC
jgi:hypothetical protein